MTHRELIKTATLLCFVMLVSGFVAYRSHKIKLPSTAEKYLVVNSEPVIETIEGSDTPAFPDIPITISSSKSMVMYPGSPHHFDPAKDTNLVLLLDSSGRKMYVPKKHLLDSTKKFTK